MGQTSAARIAANQLNAQRSTGPKTAEGKARSRANAVKHGLSGTGIALPNESQSQVEERFLRFQEDLGPTDMLGMVLVGEMALMSVRRDRAARHEAAVLALAGRHAETEFDLARLAEVDRLFDELNLHPAANHRRLLTIPEGVDRLIQALSSVKDQLEGGQARFWKEDERTEIEAFFGRSPTFFPISRTLALLEMVGGNDQWLGGNDPIRRSDSALRHLRARAELGELIAAEINRLQTIRDGFDPANLIDDRLGATDRALFDAGHAAELARKYEAAATRNFRRALRDFQDRQSLPAPDPEPATIPPALADQLTAAIVAEATPICSNEPNATPDRPSRSRQFESTESNPPRFGTEIPAYAIPTGPVEHVPLLISRLS